jgi:hypothetical protein
VLVMALQKVYLQFSTSCCRTLGQISKYKFKDYNEAPKL